VIYLNREVQVLDITQPPIPCWMDWRAADNMLDCLPLPSSLGHLGRLAWRLNTPNSLPPWVCMASSLPRFILAQENFDKRDKKESTDNLPA
jgi:hypothetical protein